MQSGVVNMKIEVYTVLRILIYLDITKSAFMEFHGGKYHTLLHGDIWAPEFQNLEKLET